MATTSTTDERHRSEQVLVVADDPVEARFVAESLELADPLIAAQRTTDTDEAIDLVADGVVDCVVADTDLGDEAVLAFVDRIAETDDGVRLLVHTDADDPAIAREAWDRGAAYARKDPELDHYDVLARHVTGRLDRE